jgi:hypothetical protein
MHYFAYLDEFGHIGPFISRTDPKHSTSPIFGFAGIVLPVNEVRNFSMYFYKLKCRLLEWEIQNTAHLPAYQWEKKGAALYTIKNIKEYEELRKATFRLINKIKVCGGFVFYSGIEKNHLPRLMPRKDSIYPFCGIASAVLIITAPTTRQLSVCCWIRLIMTSLGRGGNSGLKELKRLA